MCYLKCILELPTSDPKFAQFLKFRSGYISSVHLRHHLKLCMKFVRTYRTECKIEIRKAIV